MLHAQYLIGLETYRRCSSLGRHRPRPKLFLSILRSALCQRLSPIPSATTNHNNVTFSYRQPTAAMRSGDSKRILRFRTARSRGLGVPPLVIRARRWTLSNYLVPLIYICIRKTIALTEASTRHYTSVCPILRPNECLYAIQNARNVVNLWREWPHARRLRERHTDRL